MIGNMLAPMIVYIFFEYLTETCIVRFYPVRKKCSQPAITCSKLPIETLKHGVKYVQS